MGNDSEIQLNYEIQKTPYSESQKLPIIDTAKLKSYRIGLRVTTYVLRFTTNLNFK